MTKTYDLVMVPGEWIPQNIMRMIEKSGKKPSSAYDFFTDELSGDGDIYYIDRIGRLIVERIKMSVEETSDLTGIPTTSLMFDIKHKMILFPQLEKVYAQINGKKCTLELSFDNDGILNQVKSKIV
jgi:hypothetical protein